MVVLDTAPIPAAAVAAGSGERPGVELERELRSVHATGHAPPRRRGRRPR